MAKTTPAKILIVDDKPQNLISLAAVLEDLNVGIITAGSGNEALTRILEHEFALVLLDVQMPDMDGFETAELIRGNRNTRHLPVIFVTAINTDEKHIFKGYESGAVDYISKPLNPDILKTKVRIFLDLFNQRKMIENKNKALEEANQKILDQQNAVVEEERLKALLQLAGAAAHELNQPLMVLLGNIELLDMVKHDHRQVLELIPKIRDAGKTISETVKKIQNVRYDLTVRHDSRTEIIDLNQPVRILCVEDADEVFQLFRTCLHAHPNLRFSRAATVKAAVEALERGDYDLMVLNDDLPDGSGADLLTLLEEKQIQLPVTAVTGADTELVADRLSNAGAKYVLTRKKMTKERFLRMISSALDTFRPD